MDIFKENFPNNVNNDLYKLCFKTTVHRYMCIVIKKNTI